MRLFINHPIKLDHLFNDKEYIEELHDKFCVFVRNGFIIEQKCTLYEDVMTELIKHYLAEQDDFNEDYLWCSIETDQVKFIYETTEVRSRQIYL
jgi:hypothetical protein